MLHDVTNHDSVLWVQKYGGFGISEEGKGRWMGGSNPSTARYLSDFGYTDVESLNQICVPFGAGVRILSSARQESGGPLVPKRAFLPLFVMNYRGNISLELIRQKAIDWCLTTRQAEIRFPAASAYLRHISVTNSPLSSGI